MRIGRGRPSPASGPAVGRAGALGAFSGPLAIWWRSWRRATPEASVAPPTRQRPASPDRERLRGANRRRAVQADAIAGVEPSAATARSEQTTRCHLW
jgi:hypothetical protein